MFWKRALRSSSRLPISIVLATLVAGAVPPAQAAGGAPSPCPAAFPTANLRAGQDVEGLTVDVGRTPDPFTAEILGVIDDGIAPGLDLIVAEASSPAIDDAGGIWAGMSGSPVYAENGRLIGAVAYGLSFGASPIAGITPAADMYELLDGAGPAAPAQNVDLPSRLEDKVVASGAATRAEAEEGLSVLRMPVGISGLTNARKAAVSERINERIPNAVVYAAGAGNGERSTRPLVAGGNVGAALSYGSVTAAGVGTVTAVCDDEALLFGHPLQWSGRTTISAHNANALFVQPDPFGPFKVANLGGVVGTVNQDRLAGLHTALGRVPETAWVGSDFSSFDGRRSKTSATRVVEPSFTPEAAAVHTFINFDRVADRIGGGVVELNWSAAGLRDDGSRWRLHRRELVANDFDVSFPPAFILFDALFSILNNRFEDVTMEAVRMDGTISSVYKAGEIVGMQQLGANGRWRTIEPGQTVRLVAGSDAFLRAVVRDVNSGFIRTVQIVVRVPRAIGATGELSLTGGGGSFFFFGGEGSGGGSGGGSAFDDLLSRIESEPTGDTVTARLSVRDDGERIERTTRTTAPRAIIGSRARRVIIVAPAGAAATAPR